MGCRKQQRRMRTLIGEESKRLMAKRPLAQVVELFQVKTTGAEASQSYELPRSYIVPGV